MATNAELAPRHAPLGALGVDVPATSALEFFGVPDSPIGVEVRGVDWSSRDPEQVRLLTLALRRHLVLVLRGQPSPSDAELDDFLRQFGRLVLETDDGAAHYAGHLHRGGPASEMAVASQQYLTRAEDNSGSSLYNPGADGIAELVWHNDQSHRPMRKVLSVFEALDVEDGVVPTEFRDMYTAYETLPAHLRHHIDASSPRYAHPWRSGDLIMWDNIGVQHRRDAVPRGQRRSMRQHGGLAE
jgi:alpha-ketoglutarate-dependent taurine dioxygenase